MSVFIASLVLWLFLTGFSYQELVVGILVSIAVASVFRNYHRIKFDRKLLVRLFKFIVIYLPVFIVEMVKANIDVAARVLNPKLPLNPGFVKVKTDLESEVSRLFLANSITLTPGTLTLDGKDDHLYIHWIDVKTMDKKEEAISARFERILKGVFE
ncbi:MAG: Na+/H+ antiporter subunit E [Thermotogaceae bacterium]|nr:Na+/H+ antiporter subunit E [Thermotogaceae bacterium]